MDGGTSIEHASLKAHSGCMAAISVCIRDFVQYSDDEFSHERMRTGCMDAYILAGARGRFYIRGSTLGVRSA